MSRLRGARLLAAMGGRAMLLLGLRLGREMPAAIVQYRHSRCWSGRGGGGNSRANAAAWTHLASKKKGAMPPAPSIPGARSLAWVQVSRRPYLGLQQTRSLSVAVYWAVPRHEPLHLLQRSMIRRMPCCGSPCGATTGISHRAHCAPSERRSWACPSSSASRCRSPARD